MIHNLADFCDAVSRKIDNGIDGWIWNPRFSRTLYIGTALLAAFALGVQIWIWRTR